MRVVWLVFVGTSVPRFFPTFIKKHVDLRKHDIAKFGFAKQNASVITEAEEKY